MKYNHLTLIWVSIALIFTTRVIADNGKPDLWQFEKNGQKHYLFGSIHLGSNNMYPLSRKVTNAYKAANTLVVEIDIKPGDEAKMVSLIQKHGLDITRPLETRLSSEGKAIYTKYCKENGLPCAQFAPYKAWLLSIQFMASHLQRLGYSEELGIDKYFLKLAHQSNKQVYPLETAEEQFSMLGSFTDQQQETMLIQMIQADDSQFTDMFDSWKKGDDEALIAMFRQDIEKPGMRDMYKQMLDDRNFLMADKIESISKNKQSLFVVVGDGHVVGKTGLVKLLSQKGFKLTQLQ